MEKPTINFMLDIETLDVTPNAHILEIALVKFDIVSGAIDETATLHHKFGLKPQGGVISPDTLDWWVNGGHDVEKQRDYFITLARSDVAADLRESLSKIDLLLNRMRLVGNVRVWSATLFDSDVLNAAFKRLNETTSILIPFWETRDCRALRDIGDLYADLMRDKSIQAATHNAYEDCVRQIKYITEVTRYIESVR